MAAVPLTEQKLIVAGLTPTFTAASDTSGFTMPNSGDHFIRIKNASGSAITAFPLATGLSNSGLTLSAPSVTVPATTGDVLIGPFDPGDFGTTVTVSLSAATSVTAACIKLPRP